MTAFSRSSRNRECANNTFASPVRCRDAKDVNLVRGTSVSKSQRALRALARHGCSRTGIRLSGVQIGEIIAITAKLYVPIGGHSGFKWPYALVAACKCDRSPINMVVRRLAVIILRLLSRRYRVPRAGPRSAISPCANTCERDVNVSLCVIHRAARYCNVTFIHERRRMRVYARGSCAYPRVSCNVATRRSSRLQKLIRRSE